MGLLDDAIRQHLDLKRRRGADPTEVERAESEALGPVRRDPFEHSPDEFESTPAADDGLRAYDHGGEPYDDEAYEEYGVEEESEDRPLEPDSPDLAAGEAPEPRRGDLADPTRLMDQEYLDEPHPPLEDTGPARPSSTDTGAGDETMQYDVEEALASESTQAEPAPDWVERSDEWAEPSHEPVEPPPADKAPRFEPPPAEQEPPYFEHAEPQRGAESPVEPEEAHHSESDVAEPGVEPDAPDQDVHGGDRPEKGPHQAKPDDDVLEETPEFLQDTPDHDRLWFEQRPPRDFDFDG
jgi:hypothetical protein